MKKSIILMIVFVMIVGLFAACSNDGDNDATTTTKATTTTTTMAEPVTIEMQIAEGMEAYSDVADKYMEENPNVTVEVNFMTITEWQGILQTKLESGECADVFIVAAPFETEQYSAQGYLADLSDLSSVERFKDGTLVDSIFDGKVWTLPSQFTVVPVFYNKTIFADLGIEIPTNWDEFIDVCDTLKSNDIAPISTGFGDGWPPAHTLTALAPEVVQQELDDKEWSGQVTSGETSFEDTPQWLELYNKYQQLIDGDYYQAGALTMSHDESMQIMAKGEAAMTINGTWILPGLLEYWSDEYELGAFPLPANNPGEDLDIVNGKSNYQFAVWADSPNVEVAKDFLNFTLEPAMNKMFNDNNAPSPLKDVNVVLPDCMLEYGELTEGFSYVPFPWEKWPKGVDFIPLMTEMKAGSLTPEGALKALDEAWQKSLSE